MAKYKCLTSKRFTSGSPEKGDIVDENFKCDGATFTVKELSVRHPKDWQLVEDEFKLPEEYIVECANASQTTKAANFIKGCSRTWFYFSYVYNSKAFGSNSILYNTILDRVKSLQVIKFEQWEKSIGNEMKDKKERGELVGYKLRSLYKQCSVAASWICAGTEGCPMENVGAETDIIKLRQAGVLDIWYQPVYKKKCALPVINGCTGKIEGDLIIYGTASIYISTIRELMKLKAEITLNNKITFTASDMIAISNAVAGLKGDATNTSVNTKVVS